MMPTSDHIGISRRLEDDLERDRLRQLIIENRTSSGIGYIARTAADGAEELAIKRDIAFLDRLWRVVRDSVKTSAVPGMVWEDLPLHLRTLRDLNPEGTVEVLCDDDALATEVEAFLKKLQPGEEFSVHRWHGRETVWDLSLIHI